MIETINVREIMGVTDVAEMLGVTDTRVRQMSAKGELPCLMTRRGRIYRRPDIERIAAERAKLPPRPTRRWVTTS